MTPVNRFLAPAAFLLACASLAPCAARAEWIPLGNPACTATGPQSGGNLVPDGSGGVFVVWLDGRRGSPNTDLYATRLLADGSVSPGWPADGRVLSATGRVTLPSMADDGAGGLMTFWFDQSDYKPRMQHVDGSGALAPGFPADGQVMPMTVGGPSGYVVRALSDGAGGAYFLWNNFSGFSDVLYLTRLTSSGGFATGWSASGVAQAWSDGFNPSTGFTNYQLISDPSGGALVGAAWNVEDFPSGGHIDGSARRTLANGSAGAFGNLGPLLQGSWMSLAPDGAGGLFAAWPTGTAPTRRMQHYLSNSTAAWPNPTAAPVTDAIGSDGAGGIYLLGRPEGIDRLEMHRRLSDGSTPAPWAPAGLVLSTEGSYSSFGTQRSGNLSYVCWSNGSLGAHDVRAVAVTPEAAIAPGWHAGGTIVCNATGNQVLSAMLPLAPDKAVIAWTDRRSGNDDVYVTLLGPTGPATLDAPVGDRAGATSLCFAPRSPRPNPARGQVEFAFTLPTDGAASLEIVDASGRLRATLDAEPRGGAQALSLDSAKLPAGLYWARLRQGTASAITRFAVVR